MIISAILMARSAQGWIEMQGKIKISCTLSKRNKLISIGLSCFQNVQALRKQLGTIISYSTWMIIFSLKLKNLMRLLKRRKRKLLCLRIRKGILRPIKIGRWVRWWIFPRKVGQIGIFLTMLMLRKVNPRKKYCFR